MPELNHQDDACQHHPPTNYDVLWDVLGYQRSQQICPVSMSCNISRHTQPIYCRGSTHSLQSISAQGPVINSLMPFENIYCSYDPLLTVQIHMHAATHTGMCRCRPICNQAHTKYNPDGHHKSRGQLPNINLPSVAVIKHCHLMALLKWVQLSWGRLVPDYLAVVDLVCDQIWSSIAPDTDMAGQELSLRPLISTDRPLVLYGQ